MSFSSVSGIAVDPMFAKQYRTADNSNLTALPLLEGELMSTLPVARRGTIVAGTTSFTTLAEACFSRLHRVVELLSSICSDRYFIYSCWEAIPATTKLSYKFAVVKGITSGVNKSVVKNVI